ncbi:MAG TPA: hotdog domain-containing protein [Candidatus Enterocola sp.]|jgi:acyl-CoA thioesterase FadM|nr:hotdog domain-containing protein [Candidatus Enterocola sp.]
MNPIEIDVVVAHVDVDSMQPVFFNDEIAVQTTVEKIENKSFTLCQRIIDLKNNV